MKNTIFFLIVFSVTFNVGLVQEVKREKICYDKDSKDAIELACEFSTTFYIKGSTEFITPTTNTTVYELIPDRPNNLRKLKIKITDKKDNGSEAYKAIDNDFITICTYDLLRRNDKFKHRGEFKLDNLTSIQLLPGFTQSPTDIPTIIVSNPNDISIPVFYSFEALPLKSITITVNNETTTSENICETKIDDEINCVEFNGSLKIKNKYPNNKIELSLSYTLNDWLNCSLETMGPFKYEFLIEYPPINQTYEGITTYESTMIEESSSTPKPTRPNIIPTITTSRPENEIISYLNTEIAAIIVGSIVVLIFIIAVSVFIFIKFYKNKKEKKSSNECDPSIKQLNNEPPIDLVIYEPLKEIHQSHHYTALPDKV